MLSEDGARPRQVNRRPVPCSSKSQKAESCQIRSRADRQRTGSIADSQERASHLDKGIIGCRQKVAHSPCLASAHCPKNGGCSAGTMLSELGIVARAAGFFGGEFRLTAVAAFRS